MSDAKNKTKIEFIKNARTIFMDKGISEAYMDDIAIASGKTRRTIYRYFNTKEDLAYEVLIEVLKEWNDYQLKLNDTLEGDGLIQLKNFLYGLVFYMKTRIPLMTFLAEFDYYFNDSNTSSIDSEILKRFESIIHVSDDIIGNLLTKGVDDHSIVLKKSKQMIVATISNILWGFGQRIAVRGKSLTTESNLDPIDLLFCQIDMYIDYLENEV
ncbi:MAG: TetR/AcrR family transcriptional regulator [Clostridiales bacterium]|nr:TetR/AcrR family transcriptional regulator [Clostridiales bacterium]